MKSGHQRNRDSLFSSYLVSRRIDFLMIHRSWPVQTETHSASNVQPKTPMVSRIETGVQIDHRVPERCFPNRWSRCSRHLPSQRKRVPQNGALKANVWAEEARGTTGGSIMRPRTRIPGHVVAVSRRIFHRQVSAPQTSRGGYASRLEKKPVSTNL